MEYKLMDTNKKPSALADTMFDLSKSFSNISTSAQLHGKYMMLKEMQIFLAEKEKAAKAAVAKATPQQIKKMQQSLKRQFPGTGAISKKEAKEQIGVEAGKKAETKTLLLLGEEHQNMVQAAGYNLNIDPDKIKNVIKVNFFGVVDCVKTVEDYFKQQLEHFYPIF